MSAGVWRGRLRVANELKKRHVSEHKIARLQMHHPHRLAVNAKNLVPLFAFFKRLFEANAKPEDIAIKFEGLIHIAHEVSGPHEGRDNETVRDVCCLCVGGVCTPERKQKTGEQGAFHYRIPILKYFVEMHELGEFQLMMQSRYRHPFCLF